MTFRHRQQPHVPGGNDDEPDNLGAQAAIMGLIGREHAIVNRACSKERLFKVWWLCLWRRLPGSMLQRCSSTAEWWMITC